VGRVSGGVNDVLRSVLNDVDGVLAVAVVGGGGIVIGSVVKGGLRLGNLEFSTIATLIGGLTRRVRSINPESWLAGFTGRVVTISGDQSSIMVINDGDLSMVAVYDNSTDVNALTYTLMSSLESIRGLLTGGQGNL